MKIRVWVILAMATLFQLFMIGACSQQKYFRINTPSNDKDISSADQNAYWKSQKLMNWNAQRKN